MKSQTNILSTRRLNRLRAQGYNKESNEELSNMAFGIRFAYRLCAGIITIAIISQSTALFVAMFIIAFLGMILPKHPFDYLYNGLLSQPLNKPKLPKRSVQLKFACAIATIWLASVVTLCFLGYTNAALILAGILVIVALFPSTIDFCIPSVIFNYLFKNSIILKTSKSN